jgi:nucleoside-diphosphate-sugar epimerase
MKVLVTGGFGFVGRHVVQALQERGYDLWTPTRQEINLLIPTVWIPKDVSDERVFSGSSALAMSLFQQKIDAIVHLAGNVGGIGYNQNNQGKLGFENLQMGLNVLEAARLAHVQKLVMLGTTCSYPCAPRTIPFIEEELFDGMPELTNSGYGIAKRTLIKLGIEYHKQYGMNITNLVPANMYGPGDHFEDDRSHVIPAILKKFEEASLANRVHLWGTGNSTREFLYVEDCAKAITIALEKDTGPEPINLGTGHEISIRDLVNLIKRVCWYDSEILWDDSKPDGQPRRCLDVSRAKDILGWEASTSLEVGLKQTIEWYRQNGKN